jgi:hypothetical protein
VAGNAISSFVKIGNRFLPTADWLPTTLAWKRVPADVEECLRVTETLVALLDRKDATALELAEDTLRFLASTLEVCRTGDPAELDEQVARMKEALLARLPLLDVKPEAQAHLAATIAAL